MTENLPEHYEEERRRRSRLFFSVSGDFIFSLAGKEIARHPTAMYVYLHIIFRQPLPPRAKERKRLEKAGAWPMKPKPFSFPVDEASSHGFTRKGLLSGLRVLHDVGRIDRLHPGSATKGDFATYILSERWRNYKQPGFEAKEWPKAKVIGTRDKSTGMFIKRRIPKTARKVHVVADPATTTPVPMAEIATTPQTIVAESAMNKRNGDLSVVADPAIFLSSTYLPEESEKKICAPEVRFKGNRDQSRRPTNRKPLYRKPKVLPWSGTPEQYREILESWGPM